MTAPLSLAQRALMRDQFKQQYETANTHITVTAMALRQPHPSMDQLNKFVSAAIRLAEVCQSELTDIEPIEVLQWLQEKLMIEQRNTQRDSLFKAGCRRELIRVKQALRNAFIDSGHNNVVPFMMT